MPKTQGKKAKSAAGKYVQLAALVLLLVAVAGVFVRNNVDFFVEKKPSLSQTDTAASQKQRSAVEQAVSDTQEHHGDGGGPKPAASPAGGEAPAAPGEKEPEAGTFGVEIRDVHCRLADRDDFEVVVSLKLIVRQEALQQEILLKREDLKVVLRQVLAPKKLSDIVVEKMRAELKKEMGEILERGPIEDIEFLEFNPVI